MTKCFKDIFIFMLTNIEAIPRTLYAMTGYVVVIAHNFFLLFSIVCKFLELISIFVTDIIHLIDFSNVIANCQDHHPCAEIRCLVVHQASWSKESRNSNSNFFGIMEGKRKFSNFILKTHNTTK